MNDAHVHEMQVQMWKANTWGVTARAREELHCLGDDDFAVDGVLHLGSPPNILRRMIPIGCADQWKNYVRSAMKSQL